MFKFKNYMTPVSLIAIILQTNASVFNNHKMYPNMIAIKTSKLVSLPPLHFLTDFSETMAVDVVGVEYVNPNQTVVNSIWYNYKWDLYITQTLCNTILKTNSKFYINSTWLEREVSEFFNLYYLGAGDTRPLLLNYNENTFFLSKSNKVQTGYELKTSWHSRKVWKTNNTCFEL